MGNGSNYWDLSDLDGRGADLVGTPFANDNVKISPVGNGTGTGNCVPITCPAGQICVDAYLLPEETKTRVSHWPMRLLRTNADDIHSIALRRFKLGGLIFVSRMGISEDVERLSMPKCLLTFSGIKRRHLVLDTMIATY